MESKTLLVDRISDLETRQATTHCQSMSVTSLSNKEHISDV
jgi:hypothetical protein